MDITNEIIRLQNAKTKLKNNLVNVGLPSSNTDKIDVLVDKIALTYTKAFLKSCRSANNLFNTSKDCIKFINMDDLQYNDTAEVRDFFQTFVGCSRVISLNTSKGVEFLSMYWGCTCAEFPDIDTSNAGSITSIYSNCKNATKVSKLNIPKVNGTWSTYEKCYKLPLVEIENWNLKSVYDDGTTAHGSMFSSCYSLKAVVIRSFFHGTKNQGKGFNRSNFTNCTRFGGPVDEKTYDANLDAQYNPNSDKDGYIYVPEANVEELKSATGWSLFGDRIRPLEEYTVDRTTTGALDYAKMGIQM